MSKPNRFWIAGTVVAFALGTALVASIQASALDYVEVTALVDNAASYRGRPVKLTGKIVPATTTLGLDDAGKTTLEFQVEDARGARVRVFHRGPKPDAFRDGGVVLLEGALEGSLDRFCATTLLAQCPSRYEEELGAGTGGTHDPGSADGSAAAYGIPAPRTPAPGIPAPRRPGAP